MKKLNLCAYAFLTIIFVGMGGSLLLKDREVSFDERRKLTQLPKYKIEDVLSGKYVEKLDEYLLDQFIGRDMFRTIKTSFDQKILKKIDSNGYVERDGSIFQIETETKIENVKNAANSFDLIGEKYFPEANIYYSIIPDKNYFLGDIPSIDVDEIEKIMVNTMTDYTYIDIKDSLKLEDYYRTDLHWKQEDIIEISDKILANMSGEEYNRESKFKEKMASKLFLGGYGASSAYHVKRDDLIYLEDEIIKNATVYDYEKLKESGIYFLDEKDGIDPYNIFLGGAKALLSIKNPQNKSGKRLLLFRDSFGSSIAPLLLEEYSEIVMIDLRYVNLEYGLSLLENDEFEDVLFLYNALLLHNSHSMKLPTK